VPANDIVINTIVVSAGPYMGKTAANHWVHTMGGSRLSVELERCHTSKYGEALGKYTSCFGWHLAMLVSCPGRVFALSKASSPYNSTYMTAR
jgi:hypothetical protein